jgi:hypothetical protein
MKRVIKEIYQLMITQSPDFRFDTGDHVIEFYAVSQSFWIVTMLFKESNKTSSFIMQNRIVSGWLKELSRLNY